MKKLLLLTAVILLSVFTFSYSEEKLAELKIQTDVNKIAADGEDYAKITVSGKYSNGTKIPLEKIEIFCNDTKINGEVFVTTSEGIYTLYSKSGEVKSLPVTVSAVSVNGIKWKIVTEKFTSRALADNKVDFDGKKDIRVCLPPAYEISSTNRRFPVVYFLAGYGEDSFYDIKMLQFNKTSNNSFAKGMSKNIIYVFLNGKAKGELGSFYVNSALGKWEEYVYKDVIEVVESKYRAKQDRESRGIAGHSMGGFGALNIAMKHPDIFGAVYCTSPGLFNYETPANGVACDPFLAEGVIKERGKSFKKIKSDYENNQTGFGNKIGEIFTLWTWSGVDASYGIAFAPDEKPPYFKYPYDENGKRDEEVYTKWNMGYGGIAAEVSKYKDNWKKLKGIRIDYGESDEFKFIPAAAVYLGEKFKQAGITAVIQGNAGDHESNTYEWAEKYMYPFFSEKLK